MPIPSSFPLKKVAMFGATMALALLGIQPLSSSADVPEDADSVLQSVNVEIDSDTNVVSVADSRLYMKRDGDTNVEVGSETQKYQPIEARDELPVRISTYYQAGDREGTRLSELEGYTGRLTINVVVQNLTTDITDLSYDVAGQQKMRSGLVGVPLTAVAALETTIPASSIITSDVGGNDGLTNGVVSVKDDMTVIQWAAVMAPPHLPGVTTMTLVADVEEFEVPAINITIQPGYVSLSSLLCMKGLFYR